MASTLYIVVPCYNEQEVLPVSAPVLLKKLDSLISGGKVSENSRILFVNDGSSDGTWDIICGLRKQNGRFCGISLSHNSGEQNAYIAGMMTAVKYADVVITVDCDLQDDINAVDEMLTKYGEGNEIVYGVRKKRENESFIHRSNASLFYKIMKHCKTELPEEHSQYRLMSKRAVELLSEYGEVNIFLPALVPMIGLKHTTVEYERTERAAGESKYSFRKLLSLAVEAITSFSKAPLLFITVFTLICAAVTVVLAVFFVYFSFKFHGFHATFFIATAIAGIGTGMGISMRILGEYIVKIYSETKKRPRYHIVTELVD